MEMHYSTVTSKGQVTIPQEVRERLQIRSGDKVSFAVEGKEARLWVRNLDIKDLFGLLKRPKAKRLSVEEVDRRMQEAVAADVMRSMSRDRD